MTGPERSALHRLSRLKGVLPTYVDSGNRRRTVAAAPLCAVLRLLGVPIERASEAPELLAVARARRDTRIIPPVCVLHPGEHRTIVLRLSHQSAADPRVSATLTREDGQVERAEIPVRRGTSRSTRERGSLRLPFAVPIGYHTLELVGDRWNTKTNLFVAPRRHARPRLTLPRAWGVFVPTYALRTPGTWGCGDLSSLQRVVEWAGRHGASFVGTLPILASFLDRPFDPSPYRPVSRRFWNEVYADPTIEPEYRSTPRVRAFVRSASFQRAVSRLERNEYVDFRRVARLRRRVFSQMARQLRTSSPRRWNAFQQYTARAPDLDGYAAFRARVELGQPVSPRAHSPGIGRRRTRPSGARVDYHRYVQWVTHCQLERLAAEGRRRGVALYLDLPIGVHPNGFDAREEREVYVRGAEIGSPPDPGAPDGQQWGLPPPHPERIRERAYGSFRATLRAHLGVGRALRIDHVMGFHRLFWVPSGFSARDGAYVRYHPNEYYAILSIEAQRAGAILVGEDLGTVPPEVRADLKRYGLLRSFVAQLEWDRPDERGRYRRVPREALASLNTHDMLPFAAYWHQRQSRNTDPRERSSRGPWPAPQASMNEACRAALQQLARSPARLLLVNLEDLEGATVPQNVPGTTGRQRPNFARRMRRSWSAMESDPEVRETLRAIDAARSDSRNR
ncbi:MAG: 4-alpha-glucanotransferase [Thermoplasmata archaeon]